MDGMNLGCKYYCPQIGSYKFSYLHFPIMEKGYFTKEKTEIHRGYDICSVSHYSTWTGNSHLWDLECRIFLLHSCKYACKFLSYNWTDSIYLLGTKMVFHSTHFWTILKLLNSYNFWWLIYSWHLFIVKNMNLFIVTCFL